MNKTEFDKYLEERYEDQVKWYDSKAIFYKRLNYLFQISLIIVGAIIPIFAVLEYKWLTVILSAIIAAGTGILNFGRFEEKWHSYRTTCETLKKEKYYFQNKVSEYREADNPEELFIQRVESIISKEHTRWLIVEKSKKKENK